MTLIYIFFLSFQNRLELAPLIENLMITNHPNGEKFIRVSAVSLISMFLRLALRWHGMGATSLKIRYFTIQSSLTSIQTLRGLVLKDLDE